MLSGTIRSSKGGYCIIAQWNSTMPRLSIQIPSSKQFQLPIGLFCLIALLLSGCSSNIGSSKKEPALENPSISTHFKEPGAAATLPPVKQIVTEEPVKFWLSPDLPSFIKDDFQVHQSTIQVDSAEEADLQLIPISRDAMENIVVTTRWVYALVTPFPTLTDYVSSIDIRKAWRGEETGQFSGRPLLLSEETRRVFTLLWGEPDENGIKVLPADQLLAEAWSKQPAWALIPFEELQPRWKVLTVDGLNPFEKQMDVEKYPLAADFGFTGKQEILSKILENQTDWVSIPSTNRHPDKMTVLVMTGTTALTRGTAERMETMGVHYPAEKILPWLKDADLTHISHEIPFSEDCPPAVPVRTDWNFCSDPSYIELLKYIDADIIELTGNHIMDWGAGDLLYSLKLYMENSFLTYGGGQDLEAARQPLLVEDHGNKLAFLGCT